MDPSQRNHEKIRRKYTAKHRVDSVDASLPHCNVLQGHQPQIARSTAAVIGMKHHLRSLCRRYELVPDALVNDSPLTREVIYCIVVGGIRRRVDLLVEARLEQLAASLHVEHKLCVPRTRPHD